MSTLGKKKGLRKTENFQYTTWFFEYRETNPYYTFHTEQMN